MANTFMTGNYYKNSSREIIILVTSRTKCFINYKAFWINDPHNCYQEGKIKVKNEDGNEYILIDRFSKYSSIDEYVKYVKEDNIREEVNVKEDNIKEEVYSAVHRNFLQVGKKFKYVDLKNDILQDVIFEDTNGNGTILNFRAINKDGNPIYCHGSLFVVTLSNRDCLKPFNYLTVEEVKETLEDSDLPLHTNATVNVKEEEIKETLEDSVLPLPTNAIALVGKVTEVKILTKMVAVNPAVHHEVKLIHDPIFGWQLMGADSQLLREPLNEDKTQPTIRFKTREGASTFAIKLMAKVKDLVEKKELTFKEVQKYAENAGYELTELTNEYCNFSVSSLSDRRGKFTKLIDVVEVIKEGRLLNGEFSNLPDVNI